MHVDMAILSKLINFWDEPSLIRKTVGICFNGMGRLSKYWFLPKFKKKIECRKTTTTCSPECNWSHYVILKGIHLHMNFMRSGVLRSFDVGFNQKMSVEWPSNIYCRKCRINNDVRMEINVKTKFIFYREIDKFRKYLSFTCWFPCLGVAFDL